MSLFWKLFLTNAVIVGTLLVLIGVTPITISHPVEPLQLVWLSAGFGLVLVANLWLLRSALEPLTELQAAMDAVESARSVEPVPVRGSEEVRRVADSFNRMLERVAEEREASASNALAAQENERRRIARELHDEIGQGLTLALLQLSGAASGTGEPHDVESAAVHVRRSLEDVRSLASRLRPGVLDDLGLRAALVGLCNDLASSGTIKVVRRLGEVSGLDPDEELAVYRIAQEAMTNVIRHASASSVEVSAGRNGDQFDLTVSDDGHGLTGPEGTGILGMQERAGLVKGTLDISSAPGQGTAVRLTIPAAASTTRRQ